MKGENPDTLDNNVCWKDEVMIIRKIYILLTRIIGTRIIFTTKYHDMIMIIAISTMIQNNEDNDQNLAGKAMAPRQI